MFTRDKAFDEALASPEAADDYLAKLVKIRRKSVIVFWVTTVGIFLLFYPLMVYSPGGAAPLLVAYLVAGLHLSLSHLGAALSAQADMRALKTYKKTLELTAARQDQP